MSIIEEKFKDIKEKLCYSAKIDAPKDLEALRVNVCCSCRKKKSRLEE